MKQPDLLYFIEHVGRELAIACAVKHLAETRYGLRVEIVSGHNSGCKICCDDRTRLIVVPAVISRRGHEADGKVARIRDKTLLNLAIEQLLSNGNREFRMPKDDVAREDVLHVAAGSFYQQWLQTSGVPPAHTLLIGSLPCQLYQDPYRKFFQVSRETMAEEFHLDPAKPWVLFPENFAAAFFQKSHIRHRVRHGYDRQRLERFVEWSRKSFCELMSWCADAALLDNCEIIVRPRPAIPEASFIAAVRSTIGELPRRGFHVIKNGDIRSWVLNAQIVVSSFSTTLVEAAVAGTPAYLLKPSPIPEVAGSEWHSSAPTLSTRGEFLDLLRQPQHTRPAGDLADWAYSNLLNSGDAIENLARSCAEIVAGESPAPNLRSPGMAAAIRDRCGNGLKRLERMARSALRPRRRAAFDHENDAFSSEEVNQHTSKWAGILGPAANRHAA